MLKPKKIKKQRKNTKSPHKQDESFSEYTAANFVDEDGDKLQYSLIGLPSATGFRIDPMTGRVFGRPRQADLEVSQPLVGGIVAADGNGGMAGAVLSINIISGIHFYFYLYFYSLVNCNVFGWFQSLWRCMFIAHTLAPELPDAETPDIGLDFGSITIGGNQQTIEYISLLINVSFVLTR